MAPLTAFIAMIKGWHAVAALAVMLIFLIFIFNEAAPRAERVKEALFAVTAIPIFLFATGFLFFAIESRDYSAGQLFPSLLLASFAFVTVGLIGGMRKDPKFPPTVAIRMGLAFGLLMSGLIVGLRSLFLQLVS